MVAIGVDYVLITRELPLDRLVTQQDIDVGKCDTYFYVYVHRLL